MISVARGGPTELRCLCGRAMSWWCAAGPLHHLDRLHARKMTEIKQLFLHFYGMKSHTGIFQCATQIKSIYFSALYLCRALKSHAEESRDYCAFFFFYLGMLTGISVDGRFLSRDANAIFVKLK